MKMKLTALLLTSLICMAGAVSCGKTESAADDKIELDIPATTTSENADGTTTTEDTAATTTSADGKTTTAAADATTTSSEAAAAGADATTAAQAAETTAAPTEAPTEAQAQQQNNDNNNETQNEPEKKDIQFSTDLLLQNAADTIAALGGSPTTSVSPSCTNNGCDVKTYTYPDMEVQCYIDGGVEYIYSITIKGGDFATAKGIKVGSSRADVEAAYGTGEEMSGMIIYKDGDKEMDITYSGDTVSAIDFFTPV